MVENFKKGSIDKKSVLEHFGTDFIPFYNRYLPDLKRHGKSWMAICPYHDDKKASLSIDSEKGLFHCHACNKSGNIFTFYQGLPGQNTNGNFSETVNGIAQDFGIAGPLRVVKGKRKIVNSYDYTDSAGTLIYQAVRFDPKDFCQRRPKQGGGWIYDLKGVEPTLYNLPAILKASEILITEGEKDVDRLSGIGFTATTNSGGAGKWKPAYNEHLKGKHVVILPDNDDPGRAHAQQIAVQLQGIAQSVKVIDLPGLPSGGDVSDFLSTFRDPEAAAERLSIIIDQAEPFKESPQAEKADTDTREKSAEKPRFEFIHNAQILEALQPIEWQVEDILVKNALYYDFGDPGSYKTFGALDRLLCIAADIDYHGHRVNQGTVFYIAGEGQQGIGRRIAAWHIAHKTKAADIPFFMAKTPTQLMDGTALKDVRAAVDAMAKEYGPPAVLHIDTLARNFGEGDENATKDMNKVIHNMDSAFGNDFCRGITHHTGHMNKGRARGSIALHGAADEAFRFSSTPSGQILVECKKMKDAPYSLPMLFDLDTILLQIGDQKDRSFALTLAAEGEEAAAASKGVSDTIKASGSMKKALSLLDKMYTEYEKNRSLDNRQYSMPRVTISDWRAACIDKKYYKRPPNFNRALESMLERNLVYFDENNTFVYSVSIYAKYYNKSGGLDE